jgi:hypothetical protein
VVGIPAALLAVAFLILVHDLEHWLWHDLPHRLGESSPPWYLVIGRATMIRPRSMRTHATRRETVVARDRATGAVRLTPLDRLSLRSPLEVATA